MKIDTVTSNGKKSKKQELNPEVFGIQPNEAVVHQAIKAQLAGWRLGTASTKRRAEVRGGGKKPWRQKGTGRARAGSIRSPLWKGGGVVFGPKPRDFSQRLPKKMQKLAVKSILSDKIKNNNLIVVSELEFAKPETKKAVELLKQLGINKKTTFILEDKQINAEKSLRNIPYVKAIFKSEINPYDLLDCEFIVTTPEIINFLNTAYAENKSSKISEVAAGD